MNQEKWKKVKEEGKSRFILKFTAGNIVLLAILSLAAKIINGNWPSIPWLCFYAILLLLSPYIAVFWWNRYEKKYSNN